MTPTQQYTAEQQSRIDELRAMTPAQWDSICRGCGVCCLRKMDPGLGLTVYMDVACGSLDCATRRCRIYDRRLTTRAAGCNKVTMDIVLAGELIPASCGYREYIFGPAKYPATPDWSKIKAVSESQYKKMTYKDCLNHLIIHSMSWNIR